MNHKNGTLAATGASRMTRLNSRILRINPMYDFWDFTETGLPFMAAFVKILEKHIKGEIVKIHKTLLSTFF